MSSHWLVQKHVVLGDVEEGWKIFKEALLRLAENVIRLKRLSDRDIRRESGW